MPARTGHGARGGAVGWGTALQAGRSPVRFPLVSLKFLTWSFRPHYSPRVDSASNRNEYQEYFLGSKSGRLNPLEPSGTVQACTGIAVTLFLVLIGQFLFGPQTNPQIRKMAVTGNCTINMQYKWLHLLHRMRHFKGYTLSFYDQHSFFYNVLHLQSLPS